MKLKLVTFLIEIRRSFNYIFMSKIDCNQIVNELREENNVEIKSKAIDQAKKSTDLWEKCVLLRKFTGPQSIEAEKIIKNDLKLEGALDNFSGDGIKGGVKYEIKVSIHDKEGNINIRQIRPHHKIDFYIIVGFNLFKGASGEVHIFKIPVEIIYKLIPEFGTYTHGTIDKNGKITDESIDSNKKNSYEYSLTPKPNASINSKAYRLWQKFLKYEVTYNEDNF